MLATRLLGPASVKFKSTYHAHLADPSSIQNHTFTVPVDSATHALPTDKVLIPVATLLHDADEYDGIINWMGTNGETTTFQNPGHPSTVRDEEFTIIYSSEFSATYLRYYACDQINSGYEYLSQSAPGQWWGIQFAANRAFVVTHYAIQGHGNTSLHLRHWKLQGSQDGSAWTDLDTQTNNTTINNLTWFSQSIVDNTLWKYLRILHTGLNSGNANHLAIGEIEFWGKYYDTTPTDYVDPQDAGHAHASDNVTVSVTHNVATDESVHAMTSDQPVVTEV